MLAPMGESRDPLRKGSLAGQVLGWTAPDGIECARL
jgi:hypothetical protein